MAAPAPERWQPDRRKAKTEEWHQHVSAEDRFTWREVRNGQRQLIDFALSQWHWVGPDEDDWAEIVRVDTDHGEVHRHTFRPDGTQAVRKKYLDIECYDDYEQGRQYAIRSVVDRWDTNLRGWEYGNA
jgi:hypothetical protein